MLPTTLAPPSTPPPPDVHPACAMYPSESSVKLGFLVIRRTFPPRELSPNKVP